MVGSGSVVGEMENPSSSDWYWGGRGEWTWGGGGNKGEEERSGKNASEHLTGLTGWMVVRLLS